MTDKPTPTDAEIDALWRELFSRHDHSRAALVRAALAKWGQPAQAAEPVAWMRKWAFDGETPAKVKNEAGRLAWPLKFKLRAVTESRCLSDDMPLFTAPQPVAREPLTPEQIATAGEIEDNDSAFLAGFSTGARFAEQHHGIKGGQHVE